MTHDHTHSHAVDASKAGKALVVGILLNLVFVLVEAGAGFWQNSLALLADAGHNLSDVASLALALLAFRLAKVKPNDRFTYGYRKTTVLVALLNAVILLIAIGGIGFGAFQRIWHPEPVGGGTMAIVAGIGILINGFTAYLFIHEKDKDLNIKGAYLHMAADALVSLGVVIAGLLIVWTGWYLLDPLISFVIMIVILISTWSLLKDSLRLSLDGVPKDVDMDAIRQVASEVPGVLEMHHIHVWAMSTTQNALTAHLVVASDTSVGQTEVLKNTLKTKLEALQIHHSTFEIESQAKNCQQENCRIAEDLPDTHTHTHTHTHH